MLLTGRLWEACRATSACAGTTRCGCRLLTTLACAEIVVERLLQAADQTRNDLGRKNFVAKVWEWKEESGATITQQMRRMGGSVTAGASWRASKPKRCRLTTIAGFRWTPVSAQKRTTVPRRSGCCAIALALPLPWSAGANRGQP